MPVHNFRVPSPVPLAFACALALSLAGCFRAQIYPTLQEYRISLHQGDLEAAGVAFITPSAATGQEEEKQAVAFTFADVMKRERPRIRVVTLAEALGAINKAGLANAYKRMYDDYHDTGLFNREMLHQLGTLTGTRYIAQLKLQRFGQGEKERFGALGFRIVETRFADIRLFLQIWDSEDGTRSERRTSSSTARTEPSPGKACRKRITPTTRSRKRR